VSELAAALPEGEPPELLLELAILVVRADHDVSAHESAWLRQLAGALGVAESRLDEIQRELVA
jgi:tellurite resistance protein